MTLTLVSGVTLTLFWSLSGSLCGDRGSGSAGWGCARGPGVLEGNFREVKLFGIRLLSSVIGIGGRGLELGDLEGPFQPIPFHDS